MQKSPIAVLPEDTIRLALSDFRVTTADGTQAEHEDIVVLLRRARDVLDMDIIFIGEIAQGRQVLHLVDTRLAEDMRLQGLSTDMAATYCRLMLEARIPQVVPDTARVEVLRGMAATAALDIKAYLSVPVVLPGGEIYGTVCCISHEVYPGLAERHARSLSGVAELVAEMVQLGRVLQTRTPS